ncbi:SDR family NAD(P)-dependent oxidoreductase [Lichenihabitans psoromatis]|uniref:SDR family NAD(P)-dependent oxidoreductase n=1 Tax=Lichenihabitans psoromatis TaxID=2528642 RepID=UPI00103838F7|nr:SDR family NAD(P)-dependent oxidoreductase [Lichenihabitans psoromatis]
MTTHPAIAKDRVAVITGGASGIGLAAAKIFAAKGMKVMIADRPGVALQAAERAVIEHAPSGSAAIRAVATDVAKGDEVLALKIAAYDAFGSVDVLMNNAGVGIVGKALDPSPAWHELLGVNLWGVINGVQAFAHAMMAQGTPGLIINTGSKQGITTPPGNTAYNVSKAGVRVFTESTAHELRSVPGCRVSAHLLIPGFTFTGMTGQDEKPAAAWSGEQVVDFMLEALGRGDFYILCPDNDVDRATDEKRMAWAMGDIIDNRPALSRWHPDYAEAFQTYMGG